MRRYTSFVVIIALLSALLLYVGGSQLWKPVSGKAKAPFQMLVTVVKAEPRELHDSVEALGTTAANEAVEISATVTAKVQVIHFEDGAQVNRGDVLVELDATAPRAAVEEARVNLAEEERQLRHLQTLVERKAVSQTDVDKQQSLVSVARAKFQAASGKLEDYTLRAPFSGRLGVRRVSVGALVSPGTVISSLDDLSRIKVDFTLPEIYLPFLQTGLTVQARSPAYRDNIFSGQITFVGSRIDAVTRAVNLRAHVQNDDALLRPGMLLRVALQQPVRMALMLPERSVAPLRSEQFVFVLDEDNKAHKHKVELGSRSGAQVEIIQGIHAGDTVVVDGSMSLQDGMSVTVQAASPARQE
jgi:membrane fusion protein (multidrug efflux system)